jgi:hypothetical protein
VRAGTPALTDSEGLYPPSAVEALSLTASGAVGLSVSQTDDHVAVLTQEGQLLLLDMAAAVTAQEEASEASAAAAAPAMGTIGQLIDGLGSSPPPIPPSLPLQAGLYDPTVHNTKCHTVVLLAWSQCDVHGCSTS